MSKEKKKNQKKEVNGNISINKDSTVLFFFFWKNAFKYAVGINVVSLFIWHGVIYISGAIICNKCFHAFSPSIDSVPACPCIQIGVFLTVLWSILGIVNFLIAYCYMFIQGKQIEKFNSLNLYYQVVGFIVRVLPTYSRLIHVFSFFLLHTMALQFFLLPECNSRGLIIMLGILFFFWWVIVLMGFWFKHKVVVEPFLFSPLQPENNALFWTLILQCLVTYEYIKNL